MNSKNEADDIKALELLEKAVDKAKKSLEEKKHFQPFLMLLTDLQEVELYENEIKDSTKSYTFLEDLAKERIEKDDIDILILAVDTMIPDKFAKNIPMGIRLHLEEKSQRSKKIGARYIYVPYELCQIKDEALYVRLHHPIPVAFPAEYIR